MTSSALATLLTVMTCLLLSSPSASAFGFGADRRQVLDTFSNTFQSAVVASSVLGAAALPHPANAVSLNKVCTAGVGGDCDDLAEGNEFIKSLQKKSAENREANLKVGLVHFMYMYRTVPIHVEHKQETKR